MHRSSPFLSMPRRMIPLRPKFSTSNGAPQICTVRGRWRERGVKDEGLFLSFSLFLSLSLSLSPSLSLSLSLVSNASAAHNDIHCVHHLTPSPTLGASDAVHFPHRSSFPLSISLLSLPRLRRDGPRARSPSLRCPCVRAQPRNAADVRFARLPRLSSPHSLARLSLCLVLVASAALCVVVRGG